MPAIKIKREKRERKNHVILIPLLLIAEINFIILIKPLKY
jgi:hypothetical protein